MQLRRIRLVSGTLLLLAPALALVVGCTPGTDPPGSLAAQLGLSTPPSQQARSGLLLVPQPVLQLLDVQGNPVAGAGRLIVAALAGTGGTLLGTVQLRTDGSGRASFTNLAIAAPVGGWRLRFDSPGLTSVTSGVIQLDAGPAAVLALFAGNLQTSVGGTPVPIAPSVRLSDATGNPIVAAPVSFAADNGGSVEGGDAVTNASGIASPTRWTLGTTLGLNTLTATSSSLPGASVSFTATGSVGPPAVLTIVAGQGQSATVGGDTPVAPSVKLTDAFGHPLSSVVVNFTVASGGGSVTGSAPLTDASGIATLGSWTLGLLPGPNALSASRSGVPALAIQATGVDFPISAIAAGSGHSCALSPAGAGFCWGNNATGQLGNGAVASSSVPAAVSLGLVFTSISAGNGHSCGVVENGDGYCWGANDAGQLGDATQLPFRSTPTPLFGGHKFTTILASAGFSCGLLVDQTAACWGFGQNGQLGNGATSSRLTPTAVANGHLYTALSAGASHACGVKADGAMFCWGNNGNGKLGDGTTTTRLAPTAVNSPVSFTAVSAGASHTCALATSGAAYCWGDGAAGRLGTGATTQQLAPFAVTGDLLFSTISAHAIHSCAITTAGQGYCWGGNGFGQLGDGTTTTRLAPTAVMGGLSYTALVAGSEHTCARGSSGGAYCWGRNDLGAVGDGTQLHRTKPVGVVKP